MKDKTKKLQNLLKDKDTIYFAVCAFVLIIVLVLRYFLRQQLEEYIDIEMLISVVTAFLLTSIAAFIARKFTDKFEDRTKLTGDYDGLVGMYAANTQMLVCQNAPDSYKKKGRKSACKRVEDEQLGDTYKIPVGDVIPLCGKTVIITDDPQKPYTLPEFCRAHYTQLFNAHNFSKTYNQTTLRVSDIEERNDQVHISFSRSTYYNALVTNRAIDFKIDGISVRDVHAHGPFLASLKNSVLSNHMGFNGVVETADGQFVFVKRHGHVSIGKKTMQCSVAASLKAKYALDKSGKVTKEGIAAAIVREIEDELNLKKINDYAKKKDEVFKDFSFENNVLYFYRDLLEGGKPQLMFYVKIPVLSKEIKATFKSRKVSLLQDGRRMLFVDRDELRKMYLAPDEMVIRNKRYAAMPSAVATIVMLRQALEQGMLREDIREAYTLSKKGEWQSNEDALYVDDRFIAVIDGATAKTAVHSKITSGRFAAQMLTKHLERMPELTQPVQMLEWLNNQLKKEIVGSEFAERAETPLASIIFYDTLTRQVISYGDCQALVGGKVYKREKALDGQLAQRRAQILQTALNGGKSVQDLLVNDIGRAAIVSELLSYSQQYANMPGKEGFPVLGKGEIVPEFIDIYPVNTGEYVVLASDGYPILSETLSKSETKLAKIIKKDPLLFKKHKSTKGIAAGNVSFDDRTYIRFKV